MTGSTKAPATTRVFVGLAVLAAAALPAWSADEAEAFEPVGRLLQFRCASCHAGPDAAKGPRPEADRL